MKREFVSDNKKVVKLLKKERSFVQPERQSIKVVEYLPPIKHEDE